MVDTKTSPDEPRNDPPSSNEDVARLRLQLNHLTLSDLEAEGLVAWNRDEHVVTKGPQFDEKQPEWEID